MNFVKGEIMKSIILEIKIFIEMLKASYYDFKVRRLKHKFDKIVNNIFKK